MNTTGNTMLLGKRMKDLTGLRYGSLVALSPHHIDHLDTVVWLFKCDCGKLHSARGSQIKAVKRNATNPKVPSCGCILIERAIETNTIHGYSKHPLNAVWQAMKQRCYNPDHLEYARYGAKGVTVCSEWLESPETFINWALAAGWKKGMHLDKDTLSDLQNTQRKYAPETCTFLPSKVNVGYSASRANHLNNTKIKLTPQNVVEIKNLYTSNEYDQRQIANKYGVSQASIWRAINS